MKSLIRFWKNDLINKLIVLISLALIAATGVIAYLLFNMPEGKSLQGAISDVIPWVFTPTRVVISPSASAGTQGAGNEGPTLSPGSTPAPTRASPAASPTIKATLPPTLTATPTPPDPMACIPHNPVQKGRVLEITDGNTVRVLINGLVYVVRYTGVEAPTEARQAIKAREQNAKLVFGKDVTLISDVSDKDPRGRLLRYVLAGDIYVNLEMIQSGYGMAVPIPPDTSCDEVFKAAQQSAMDGRRGLWVPTATPQK